MKTMNTCILATLFMSTISYADEANIAANIRVAGGMVGTLAFCAGKYQQVGDEESYKLLIASASGIMGLINIIDPKNNAALEKTMAITAETLKTKDKDSITTICKNVMSFTH